MHVEWPFESRTWLNFKADLQVYRKVDKLMKQVMRHGVKYVRADKLPAEVQLYLEAYADVNTVRPRPGSLCTRGATWRAGACAA